MTDKIIINNCAVCGKDCNRKFRNSSNSISERKLYYKVICMEVTEDEKNQSEGMEYNFCGSVCLSRYFE